MAGKWRQVKKPAKQQAAVKKKPAAAKLPPKEDLTALSAPDVERLCREVLGWVWSLAWLKPHLQRCTEKHHKNKLTVVSACSGWSSELLALEMMQKRFTACACCELDSKVRALGARMHGHHHEFQDACSHSFLKSPGGDLFCAGFPCQPFSAAGKNEGIADSAGRGMVVFWLVAWVYLHRPIAFVFENVGDFATRHRETLLLVMMLLMGLDIYDVQWQVLGCHTHGSLPQLRNRLFIVGVRKDRKIATLTWPKEKPMLSVGAFLRSRNPPEAFDDDRITFSQLNATEKKNLKETLERLKKDGHDPDKEHFIIDVSGSKPHHMLGVSPCLTRTRSGTNGHWMSWLGRKMTTHEVLALQGVATDRVGNYWEVMSTRQLRQVAGNAVPIPLMAEVLAMVCAATRF